MSEHFYKILLESKQGKYGIVFYLHEVRDPQVIHYLLRTLAKRRLGPPLDWSLGVERYEDSDFIKTVLELNSQQDIADILLLHAMHPKDGLRNVRIRNGQLRDKDVLAVQLVLLPSAPSSPMPPPK